MRVKRPGSGDLCGSRIAREHLRDGRIAETPIVAGRKQNLLEERFRTSLELAHSKPDLGPPAFGCASSTIVGFKGNDPRVVQIGGLPLGELHIRAGSLIEQLDVIVEVAGNAGQNIDGWLELILGNVLRSQVFCLPQTQQPVVRESLLELRENVLEGSRLLRRRCFGLIRRCQSSALSNSPRARYAAPKRDQSGATLAAAISFSRTANASTSLETDRRKRPIAWFIHFGCRNWSSMVSVVPSLRAIAAAGLKTAICGCFLTGTADQ